MLSFQWRVCNAGQETLHTDLMQFFLCLPEQCFYNLHSRFSFFIALVVMRWRFGKFDVLSFTELRVFNGVVIRSTVCDDLLGNSPPCKLFLHQTDDLSSSLVSHQVKFNPVTVVVNQYCVDIVLENIRTIFGPRSVSFWFLVLKALHTSDTSHMAINCIVGCSCLATIRMFWPSKGWFCTHVVWCSLTLSVFLRATGRTIRSFL